MGSVIVITSGKGGTGKTSLTGGLGATLALLGKQVLCLDGDVGLRNLDITLGMTDAALGENDRYSGEMARCNAVLGEFAVWLRRNFKPVPRRVRW